MTEVRVPGDEMTHDVFNPRRLRWRMMQAGMRMDNEGLLRQPFRVRYDPQTDEIVYTQEEKV